YRFIYVDATDFTTHLRFAKQMWETHSITQPHFLFHMTVGILQQPLMALGLSAGDDYRLSGLITSLSCTAVAALLIQSMVRRWRNGSSQRVSMAALVTMTLLITTPFPLFVCLDRKLYVGCLGI